MQDERRYENDDLTGTWWNAQCRSAKLTRPDVSSPGSIWDVGKFRSPADEGRFQTMETWIFRLLRRDGFVADRGHCDVPELTGERSA